MKDHKNTKFNLFSTEGGKKHHQSVRSQGGNGGLMQGFEIPDITCQGCKLSLFAFKLLISNKFVEDMGKMIFVSKICPLIVVNATVCEGSAENVVSPLIDVFKSAIIDPEYFCENTLVLCHDGDYQMFHSEDYTNKLLSTKP